MCNNEANKHKENLSTHDNEGKEKALSKSEKEIKIT